MLILLVIVIIVALALQRYSVKRAQDCRDIHYECAPSVRACEPGDVFLVYSTVSNHGRRPSLTMRVEERFPKLLNVLEADEYNVKVLKNDCRIYNSTVIVRSRQQVKRFLRASISERGEYHFSFAEFYAGDFLGFYEFEFLRENDSTIVIYPPKIEDGEFLKAFTNTVDEITMKKQLLEDPISVREYRDYTGREPMRQISWTQSAVRNRLMVKQFDPVWQFSLMIVLDAEYHGEFDMHRRRQEYCFSLVRTICELLEKRMIGYSLITNANISGGISRFSSSGGMGGSFNRILYALGSAGNGCVCPTAQLMREVLSDNNRREKLIFVSTRRDDEVTRALDMTREYTGDSIVTLFADELMPPDAPGDTERKEDEIA